MTDTSLFVTLVYKLYSNIVDDGQCMEYNTGCEFNKNIYFNFALQCVV